LTRQRNVERRRRPRLYSAHHHRARQVDSSRAARLIRNFGRQQIVALFGTELASSARVRADLFSDSM
jgi:hypothetical protein